MSEQGNGVIIKCEDVHEVLFDYMNHELGRARSELVRAHLRKCAECQALAADIQKTTELLRRGSREMGGVPARLSEERRALVRRAVLHPALDWVCRHNAAVSILAVVVFLVVLTLVLRHTRLWEEESESGVEVTIGNGPPPSAEQPLTPAATPPRGTWRRKP